MRKKPFGRTSRTQCGSSSGDVQGLHVLAVGRSIPRTYELNYAPSHDRRAFDSYSVETDVSKGLQHAFDPHTDINVVFLNFAPDEFETIFDEFSHRVKSSAKQPLLVTWREWKDMIPSSLAAKHSFKFVSPFAHEYLRVPNFLEDELASRMPEAARAHD